MIVAPPTRARKGVPAKGMKKWSGCRAPHGVARRSAMAFTLGAGHTAFEAGRDPNAAFAVLLRWTSLSAGSTRALHRNIAVR